MKIADKITLRYANTLVESDYTQKNQGSVEFTLKVKLADLTSKAMPNLRAQLPHDDLTDDNVAEAFTAYYFASKEKLEGSLWSKIKHLDGVSGLSIEDIEGLPKKLSDLKNLELEFKVLVHFELPYKLLKQLENTTQDFLKAQFY